MPPKTANKNPAKSANTKSKPSGAESQPTKYVFGHCVFLISELLYILYFAINEDVLLSTEPMIIWPIYSKTRSNSKFYQKAYEAETINVHFEN